LVFRRRKQMSRARILLSSVLTFWPIVLIAADAADAATPTIKECADASEAGQRLLTERRFRAAAEHLDACAVKQCPDVIRRDCTAKRDEARRSVAVVRFVVTDRSGQRVPEVEVQVDGVRVARTSNGGIEVDPGEHEFSFAAPKLAPATKRLDLRAGVKSREEVVVLAPTPLPEARTSRPDAVATNDAASQPPANERERSDLADGAVDRWADATWLYVGIGVGSVGLITTGVFGLLWLGARSDDRCPDRTNCPASFDVDGQNASLRAYTIGFAAGAGLLVAGAIATTVVLVGTPSPPAHTARGGSRPGSSSPTLRVDPTGIGGTF
jgi:hypothetical protein